MVQQFIFSYICKGSDHKYSGRHLYTCVHRSTVHSSQNVGTPSVHQLVTG